MMSPHSLCSLRNVTFLFPFGMVFCPGTSTGRHSVLVQLECTSPGGRMNLHQFDQTNHGIAVVSMTSNGIVMIVTTQNFKETE